MMLFSEKLMRRVAAAVAALVPLCGGAGDAPHGWVQSYNAGYSDVRGRYAGGSEIMHLAAHKGRLFAFNGFWKDRNFGRLSAQVLRLDAPGAGWQVDLDTTRQALGYTRANIRHMKGNILKSVTFTTDKRGRPIMVNLLIGAAWAYDAGPRGLQAVSCFVRNDADGTWQHTTLQEGPNQGRNANGKRISSRRVPRDIEIYRDPDTGIDRIFMLIGNPGVLSGVFNADTGRIEWDAHPEYPRNGVILDARPLGMTAANGRLYFSSGGRLFVRHNGPNPSWTPVYTVSDKNVNVEMGGIRGLSTIPNPTGSGDSLIFAWTSKKRSAGQIYRLDGPDLALACEPTLRALYNTHTPHAGSLATTSLGAYNRFVPVTHPRTGKTVHLVGFQQMIRTPERNLTWHRYYKGAMFGIRHNADTYETAFVNGPWAPGKPVLVAPRAFALSPFPSEKDVLYVAGFDANFQTSTDRAWIFKAPLTVALGLE